MGNINIQDLIPRGFMLQSGAPLQGNGRLFSQDPFPQQLWKQTEVPAQVRIDIHRRQQNDAGWTGKNSFMTNSEVRPYLDVDGDGVPGIISLEWYNEAVPRLFSPEIEVIAIDHSGV
jgi:hypothetical protein